MKSRLNNRGNFPAFLLFSIGLTYLFLFGTSPVRATDLKIIKTADKSNYQVGDTITFTITIDNTSSESGGPYDSPNTTVVDFCLQAWNFNQPRPLMGLTLLTIRIQSECVVTWGLLTPVRLKLSL